MRAIDPPCGHHFEATDDDELFRLCREHVDSDHPEMQRPDEQLHARIAADAYEVAAQATRWCPPAAYRPRSMFRQMRSGS
jgi:predicted small metal-binding protein